MSKRDWRDMGVILLFLLAIYAVNSYVDSQRMGAVDHIEWGSNW